MQFKIIRRILDSTHTIGYEVLSDRNEIKRLDRNTTVEAIKQGLIINATLQRGTNNIRGLGIDLRTIPSIQKDEIIASKNNVTQNKPVEAGRKPQNNRRLVYADYHPLLEQIVTKAKLVGTDPSSAIFKLIDRIDGCAGAANYLEYYNGTISIQAFGLSEAPQYIKYVTSLERLCHKHIFRQDIRFDGISIPNCKSTASMFCDCLIMGDRYLDISGLDTQYIINADKMFKRCIGNIGGIEKLNTSNMLDISEILCGAGPAIDFHDWELVDRAESDFDILDAGPFADDDVYETLDLSHWNTRNVIFMQKAFKNCHYDLVGLENWDVSRVVDFSEAFCDYKPSSAIDGVLDLSNWKLNPTANTQGMFRWCKADVIATDPTLLKALKADRLDQMWGVQYDM